MHIANVRLYLRSQTKIALPSKNVQFAFPPRAGEWIKLKNSTLENYLSIRIEELTHIEGEKADVMLEALPLPEEELEEYVDSYKTEGWTLESLKLQRTGVYFLVGRSPAAPTAEFNRYVAGRR